MKTILKKIWVFIKWIFYFIITIDARNRFLIGESRGMKCVDLQQGLFSDKATFSKHEKPEKEYATFKEFWNGHFPKPI